MAAVKSCLKEVAYEWQVVHRPVMEQLRRDVVGFMALRRVFLSSPGSVASYNGLMIQAGFDDSDAGLRQTVTIPDGATMIAENGVAISSGLCRECIWNKNDQSKSKRYRQVFPGYRCGMLWLDCPCCKK